MNTTLSCWICRIDMDVDYYWTESIRNVLNPFQNNHVTCQFIHHLQHMKFPSSSPFRISMPQLEDVSSSKMITSQPTPTTQIKLTIKNSSTEDNGDTWPITGRSWYLNQNHVKSENYKRNYPQSS